MEVIRMDENDWKYHGEGNKSLVVSHSKSPSVLRFLKFPVEDQKTCEEILRHLQNTVDFGKHIMRPFLGENYVHYGEVIPLPLDFVKQLSVKIQPDRPESRCHKVMDILSGYALRLPNLTTLHKSHCLGSRLTFSVEIKPKCGFLPLSSHITETTKHKVCRYCMHQHLKIANGKWKRISKYCPLDLFSGNKQRMFFALTCLLQDAQNNLKIFKNGELIYGCKDKDSAPDLNDLAHHLKHFFFPANGLTTGPFFTTAVINELLQVITMALLSPPDSCRTDDTKKLYIPEGGRTYCDASYYCREILKNGKSEYSELPKGCVLSKILQVQRLDMMDIEGLYPLYRRVERHLQELPNDSIRLHIDGPYDDRFSETLLDVSTEDDLTVEYAVTKVQQYRVAMTAKDCSVMITFSPCLQDTCSDQSLLIQTSKSKLECSVSILDLDLKPYEDIPNQYKLDKKIVNYFLKTT
ncbi:inositol-pentakisphosphate 2-kinase [Protopterus annectens]|uniref:inositol-pentakisphosphate 2-kinase n=1 Tax=Protopterus annectens TaxID=7888 RepID=UPI001CFC0D52|nr:inositol-pentakisphosphate 2-kinase [Protopterus annectens]